MIPQLKILSNVIERLNKLNEANSGHLYGVLSENSLTVFTYTFNIHNVGNYFDLQSSMPGEIDFCGILSIDQGEQDIPNAFKDIDVTDNPLLLKYSLKERTLQAYFYIHQKLENVGDVEIINEADVLQQFTYIRIQGVIPLVSQREHILDTLQEIRKSIASGKIGFHFSHCDEYVLGADGDESLANTSVKDICSKTAEGSAKRNDFKYISKIMDVIPVDMFLKISRNKDNEGPKYAPVLHHVKRYCDYHEINLKLDALSVVNYDELANRLYEILVESVCRNLRLLGKAFEHQLTTNDSVLKFPQLIHVKPSELGHPVTMVYLAKSFNDDMLTYRRYLHRIFGLQISRPYFRFGNAVKFSNDLSTNEPLLNPHEAIPVSKGNGKICLVHGLYSYHHYMQDNFNDEGWGCAYRSLQTIVSWFRFQGYTEKPIPTHRDIQKCLVNTGDETSDFIGSKKWIGSVEVSHILEAMFGISSKILHVSNGEEISTIISDLAYHFEIQGTPVMIGGGVLAHTILGVSYDEISGNNVKFLILDPHYTGPEHLSTIINKGWCAWKTKDFWRKDSFYNMCLPHRPNCI